MTKFSHLFIAPSDFEKSLKFYNETLGWKIGPHWGEKGKEPRGAYLISDGGMTIVIAEEHDTADNSWTHGFNGHRPTMQLDVNDLEAAFSKLPKGSHVLVPPQDTHWGTRWFVVKDPDDNIIAFNEKKP